MNKICCLVLLAPFFLFNNSCEFSFGEKEEIIFQGIADPNVKVGHPHSPSIISKKMTEDLSDRGWIKQQTLIYTGGKISEYLKAKSNRDIFESFRIEAITTIPYAKEINPNENVVLTFYDVDTPFNAYSLFTILRQQPMKEYYFGERELIIRKHSCLFWEGPFLIIVKTSNLGDDTRNVLLGVSKGISYKLYGLIGTYDPPDISTYFPPFERVKHSVQIVMRDPFQLPKPEVCLKAVYKRDSGESMLYILTDPSSDRMKEYRNLLVAKLFMNPKTAILASFLNDKKESIIWMNTLDYGIIEIGLKKNLLAIHQEIGIFKEGIERVPGLKEIATSSVKHENFQQNITINPYKQILIIKNAKRKINDIVMLGLTGEVLREIQDD